jgi:hypothetical protein
MKTLFRKRIKWIGYGCLLIACFAIWQNWFVATHLAQIESAFKRGDLEVVKTSLATVSPFAGSWFLPAKRSARLFGLQSDLALARNDLAAGLELQSSEYEMLGILHLPLGSSVSAEKIWKNREGASRWGEGFKEYQNSPDPDTPLDERELLPKPSPPLPEEDNAWHLTRKIESFKDRQHDLAGLISDWSRGDRDTAEMSAPLSTLHSDLAILREAARKPGWQPPTRDLEGNMADCARLLLIDFIHSAEQGNFESAASAFEDHCQFVANLKGQPSIAQLLFLIGMRGTLNDVFEHSVERISFPDEALVRLANALSGSAMESSFPSECVRYSYADMKQLLTTSMLDPSGENAPSPVAPHLLSVTLRKVFQEHKILADALAPEALLADPFVETYTDRQGRTAAALLELRRAFSNAIYGKTPLTKERGQDAAKLLIESIAENTASNGTLRLGRVQATIREQWDLEEALLQKVKSLRD